MPQWNVTKTTVPGITSESSTVLKGLIDTTSQTIRALRALNRPVDQWDDLLVFITTQRLDYETRKGWEISISSSREMPNFEGLIEFLEQRVRNLELVDTTRFKSKPASKPQALQGNLKAHHVQSENRCIACNQRHLQIYCQNFKDLSVEQSRHLFKNAQLCFNCFRPHQIIDSPSDKKCRECGGRHHTMVHLSDAVPVTYTAVVPDSSEFITQINEPTALSQLSAHIAENTTNHILLATVQLNTNPSKRCWIQGPKPPSSPKIWPNDFSPTTRRRADVVISGIGVAPSAPPKVWSFSNLF